MSLTDWDLAGFTDNESRLGKPVPAGELLVPNTVSLDAEKKSLLFVPKDKSRRVPPARSMFNEFVRLWQKSPAVILRFARKWGPLNLNPQGKPCAKAYTPRYSSDRPSDRQELPRSE